MDRSTEGDPNGSVLSQTYKPVMQACVVTGNERNELQENETLFKT